MAQKMNIIVDQGTTFSTTFTMDDDYGNPLDLTDYVGGAQIRKYYSSCTAYSFAVSTSNTGLVTLSMDANTTANIAAGRYVYDVYLADQNGIESRVVEGVVTVTPQVTR